MAGADIVAGCRVRVVGLTSRPEVNGQEGVAVSFNGERWSVKLIEETVDMQSAKLVLLGPADPVPEPEPTGSRWSKVRSASRASTISSCLSRSALSRHARGLQDPEAYSRHNEAYSRPPQVSTWHDTYFVKMKWICTYAYGSSSHAKLLRYRLDKLVHVGGILSIPVKGTLLTMDPFTNTIMVVYFTIGALIASAVYGLIPGEINTDAVIELNTVVMKVTPFVLGLYISIAMARWWALREICLDEMFDSLSNVVALFSNFFPDPEYQAMRNCLGHYGIAAVYLLAANCRETDVLPELQAFGLLTGEEVEIIGLVPAAHRPEILWAWILRVCYESWMLEKRPPPMFGVIQDQICQARNGIQAANTYLDTPLPFPYVQLVTLLANITNIVVCIKCGMTFARGLRNADPVQCVVEVLFVVLVPFCYQGLLALTYIIFDPFGDDVLDFPVMAYTEYVKDNCAAVDLAQQSCPVLHRTPSAGEPDPPPLDHLIGGSAILDDQLHGSGHSYSVKARVAFGELRKKKAQAKAAPAPFAPLARVRVADDLPETALSRRAGELVKQVTQLKEELMTHLRSQTQLDLPAPAAGA
jgi:predicted membrane chloride channel (bestrophin family)